MVLGVLARQKCPDGQRTIRTVVDSFTGPEIDAIVPLVAFIEGQPVDFMTLGLAFGSLERSVWMLDDSNENSRSSHDVSRSCN